MSVHKLPPCRIHPKVMPFDSDSPATSWMHVDDLKAHEASIEAQYREGRVSRWEFAPSWADTKSAELAAVSRRERKWRIGLAWLVSIGLLAFVGAAIWVTTP